MRNVEMSITQTYKLRRKKNRKKLSCFGLFYAKIGWNIELFLSFPVFFGILVNDMEFSDMP